MIPQCVDSISSNNVKSEITDRDRRFMLAVQVLAPVQALHTLCTVSEIKIRQSMTYAIELVADLFFSCRTTSNGERV